MQFSELASYFQRIEETSLRNQKTAILAELLAKLTSEEVAQVAYLSVGRVGPLYDPLEFGLAAKMVIRAIAWGTGTTPEAVMVTYKKVGDLGTLVATHKGDEAGQATTITRVYDTLVELAKDS